MEIWEIEAFLAIARTRSLTEAAKTLHLSQSTVSHRLKKLELSMKAKLVERHKGHREIQLTPMGEEFSTIAEKWNDLMREVEILQNHGPRISLSIGAVDSLNAFVLPPLYRMLNAQTNPVILRIRTHQTVELYELLEQREVDVAFVLQERYYSSLEVKRVFSEPMVVLTPYHGAIQTEPGSELHPQDLDSSNELYINWGSEYQLWHDQWWDPLCPFRVRVDTAQLILALMHKPEHWAIVPISMARSLSEDKRFKFHHLSAPPPDRICYRVKRRTPKSSTMQGLDLLDTLLEQLNLVK
ncbi:LysR family transcriptional regulator [Alicyclobacillus dauci]|uniref:LysR family transcriptional regulator n=1 Tax=Alicyclobacillus dauci TaxID=1475485 RepID=A0ABY6Z614_9BACL|nr:LysR family transcriptional regulator [Alicyclobacillus dauci]WAH37631.1 LysR family transcriptional regulator [Alicyclobacillus dauci]